MKAPARNNSGFTLVEMLIVLAIISLLMIVSVNVFKAAKHKAADARASACARHIASSEAVSLTINDKYVPFRDLPKHQTCDDMVISGNATNTAYSYDVHTGLTGNTRRVDTRRMQTGDVHRDTSFGLEDEVGLFPAPPVADLTLEATGPNGSGVRMSAGQAAFYTVLDGNRELLFSAVADPSAVVVLTQGGRVLARVNIDNRWPPRLADGSPLYDVRFARYTAGEVNLSGTEPVMVSVESGAALIGSVALRN